MSTIRVTSSCDDIVSIVSQQEEDRAIVEDVEISNNDVQSAGIKTDSFRTFNLVGSTSIQSCNNQVDESSNNNDVLQAGIKTDSFRTFNLVGSTSIQSCNNQVDESSNNNDVLQAGIKTDSFRTFNLVGSTSIQSCNNQVDESSNNNDVLQAGIKTDSFRTFNLVGSTSIQSCNNQVDESSNNNDVLQAGIKTDSFRTFNLVGSTSIQSCNNQVDESSNNNDVLQAGIKTDSFRTFNLVGSTSIQSCNNQVDESSNNNDVLQAGIKTDSFRTFNLVGSTSIQSCNNQVDESSNNNDVLQAGIKTDSFRTFNLVGSTSIQSCNNQVDESSNNNDVLQAGIKTDSFRTFNLVGSTSIQSCNNQVDESSNNNDVLQAGIKTDSFRTFNLGSTNSLKESFPIGNNRANNTLLTDSEASDSHLRFPQRHRKKASFGILPSPRMDRSQRAKRGSAFSCLRRDTNMTCIYSDQSLRNEAISRLHQLQLEKESLPEWRHPIQHLVLHNKTFDNIVLVLIVLNCLFLALENPEQGEDATINTISYWADFAFTAVFTVEVGVRILGQGLYGTRFSYLRDAWNVLDLIIVTAGITTIIIDFTGNSGGTAVTGLRAFRLFKPLRAVTKVREVHIIVNSLLQSLPRLIDALLLFLLFLLIMSIVAVQLWKGSLRYHCVANIDSDKGEITDRVCSQSASVSTGYHCPWGYSCIQKGNPQNGKISFDNIVAALLTIFTIVTLEGWAEVMYNVFDATSTLAFLYFVLVICFGSFFIVNLTLVIINNAFMCNVEQQLTHEESLEGIRKLILSAKQKSNLRKSLPVVADNQEVQEMKIRTFARSIVASRVFVSGIHIAIVLNSVLLGIQYHNQPKEMTNVSELANTGFTLIYALEILIKLIAFPIKEFSQSKSNCFDFTLVVGSLVELTVTGGEGTSFNSLRLFRIFETAKRYPSLWLFLLAIAKSVKSVAVLTLLLLIVMFTYALLGMQLFGTRYCGLADPSDQLLYADPPDSKCPLLPRQNFNNLFNSLIIVFQIISGEDWNQAMYNGMSATHDSAACYFVSLFVIGNYVVLNLFIAILLNGLETSREERLSIPIDDGDGGNDGVEIPQLKSSLDDDSSQMKDDSKIKCWKSLMKYDYALFVLSKDNSIRIFLKRIVENIYFELLVMGFILASTISLALENPFAAPDTSLPQILKTLDIILSLIFATEAILKIGAYGLMFHSDSYLLRDAWNILDFIIVLIGIVDTTLELTGENDANLEYLVAIRLLRTLRPLRFINKSPGLKRVVDSLVGSIKGLAHVVVITAVTFIIFAIVGMQLFMGRFHSCSSESWGDISQGRSCPHIIKKQSDPCPLPFIIDKSTCLENGYRWEVFPSNFDSLGNAIVALFEIATLEGWIQLMHLGTDSTSLTTAPSLDHRKVTAIYFIVVIVVVAFFLVNLFVGVLLAQYEDTEPETSDSDSLSDHQIEWRLVMKILIQNASDIFTDSDLEQLEKHSFRWRVRSLISNPKSDHIISAVILLNVLVMTLEHEDQPPEWSMALDVASYIFIFFFMSEAYFKIYGLSIRVYFSDRWNRFDFSVMLLSVIGAVMSIVVSWTPVLSVFRVFRLARLLRVARMTRGVRLLLRTLFLSVPSLVNIAALQILLFSLYAILGVKIFGKLSHGRYINQHVGFQNFTTAVMTLFRICTGEAWEGIMHEAAAESGPYCDVHLDSCGNRLVAYLYFITFTVIAMFTLLNLIVAVILKEFVNVSEEESGIITSDHVSQFIQCWDACDTGHTGFIAIGRFYRLLSLITSDESDSPFRCQVGDTPFRKVLRIGMHLTPYGNTIHNKDLLLHMAIDVCSANLECDYSYFKIGSEKLVEKFLSPRIPPSSAAADISVVSILAAIRLQSVWRGIQSRKVFTHSQSHSQPVCPLIAPSRCMLNSDLIIPNLRVSGHCDELVVQESNSDSTHSVKLTESFTASPRFRDPDYAW